MSMKADRVYRNGTIYTIDDQNSQYEAMAIRGDRILALGTNLEIEAYIGETTDCVNLNGTFAFPGFSETHAHAPGLAYDTLFNVNLYDATSAEDTINRLHRFVNENPDRDIYYGRGFNAGFFEGEESVIGPRKERLDAICSDKPIILADFGGNFLWLNSKALDLYHITKETQSPEDGVVEVDPVTGELWGILREGARVLVPYQSFTEEQRYQAAKWFQEVMNSYGYTSVFALRPPGTVEPRTACLDDFLILEKRGELTLRVQGARDINPFGDIDEQIEEMKRLRGQYGSELVQFTTAKFFLDGVVESGTACLLDPYESSLGKGPEYRGTFIWDLEKLAYGFRRSMEEGFQIHCHTIGDGAVKKALDAFEMAFAKVPPGDYRHALTHLQLVSDADKKRMADLHIIANLQPFWQIKSPTMWWNLEQPLIGDRADREYPFRSLLDAGVLVTASSDYPVTPEPNPLYAIQAAVTRNLYHAQSYQLEPLADMDDPKYLLNREERVTVMDVIKAYTRNAAYSRYQESSIGSLEVGKQADFLILNQDPFAVNPLDLEKISIEETSVKGKVVYTK